MANGRKRRQRHPRPHIRFLDEGFTAAKFAKKGRGVGFSALHNTGNTCAKAVMIIFDHQPQSSPPTGCSASSHQPAKQEGKSQTEPLELNFLQQISGLNSLVFKVYTCHMSHKCLPPSFHFFRTLIQCAFLRPLKSRVCGGPGLCHFRTRANWSDSAPASRGGAGRSLRYRMHAMQSTRRPAPRHSALPAAHAGNS